MAVKITYEVIKEQALKQLAGVDLATRDLTPVMTDFAAYMKGSTQRNFDAGGRPRKWAPLKLASLAGWLASRKGHFTKAGNVSQRGREALAGRLVLTDTTRLRNSIQFTASARSVEGFTNVKYAAIHQFGGKTGAHDIKPKNKKALFWPGAGHPVKLVHHPGSTLPARPFLVFQDEDVYGYLYPRIVGYVEGAGG